MTMKIVASILSITRLFDVWRPVSRANIGFYPERVFLSSMSISILSIVFSRTTRGTEFYFTTLTLRRHNGCMHAGSILTRSKISFIHAYRRIKFII